MPCGSISDSEISHSSLPDLNDMYTLVGEPHDVVSSGSSDGEDEAPSPKNSDYFSCSSLTHTVMF